MPVPFLLSFLHLFLSTNTYPTCFSSRDSHTLGITSKNIHKISKVDRHKYFYSSKLLSQFKKAQCTKFPFKSIIRGRQSRSYIRQHISWFLTVKTEEVTVKLFWRHAPLCVSCSDLLWQNLVTSNTHLASSFYVWLRPGRYGIQRYAVHIPV